MKGPTTELDLTSLLNRVLLPRWQMFFPGTSQEERIEMVPDGNRQALESNRRKAMPFDRTVRSWVHSNRQRDVASDGERDKDVEHVTIECSSPALTQPLELQPGQKMSFGRRSAADHCVDSDRCMSNVHFSIECETRNVVMMDLDSTNGTFVNGHRAQRMHLHDGDQVIAGTTIFKIQVSHRPKSIST